MFKPLSLFVGLRYTRARRRNHFISFISLTSIIGLGLGVAVLIVVLSVMNGFDRELKQRILGMVPHGSLVGVEPIADWTPLAAQVARHPGVAGVAPFSQMQAMVTGAGTVEGAVVNGIVPAREQDVSILPQHIIEGSLDSLAPGSFGIVLGSGLARRLGVSTGDKVTLVLPEATVSPAGVMPRFKRFTVTGIFRVGAEIDISLAYVHLDDAAVLLRHPHTAQALRVKMHDLFAAPDVMQDLVMAGRGTYYGVDWTRTHGSLFQAVKMEKSMMTLLLLFIVGVAAFNIVSSLVMVVTDKKGDIAILRTLGASPGEVMRIFMVQGVVIGVVGTLAGVLLGVLLALTISDIVAWIEQASGAALLEAYFVNFLPSELRMADVFMVSAIAFSLSFAATVYPALRAAQVHPAEALRYE
ncbi:MAG: lipoprotein-releasing ABC transporter permease subunit [Pseudomonadota bacterium]